MDRPAGLFHPRNIPHCTIAYLGSIDPVAAASGNEVVDGGGLYLSSSSKKQNSIWLLDDEIEISSVSI
jgi:hypothetical protein